MLDIIINYTPLQRNVIISTRIPIIIIYVKCDKQKNENNPFWCNVRFQDKRNVWYIIYVNVILNI